MLVQNVPKGDGDVRKYVVVREVDNQLWYWGSWDELDRAYIAAKEIGGIMMMREDVE